MTALINTAMQFYHYNTQLCNLYVIAQILQEERQHHVKNSFFHAKQPYALMLEKYELCKFLLKRMENEKPLGDLYSKVIEGMDADELVGIKVIAEHAVEDAEGVMQRLR